MIQSCTCYQVLVMSDIRTNFEWEKLIGNFLLSAFETFITNPNENTSNISLDDFSKVISSPDL